MHIRVGGTTTLTGALIDSTADKDKNRITTGDLALYHITNNATLKDGNIGIGGSSGAGTKPNEQGLLPQLPIAIGSDSTSHTYAAIVDGDLHITGNTKVSAEDINRNTQDTLNALDNTLDLQAIQERKRLAELFAKYANAEVHKLSETQKWQEGSAEKVILHAIVGGLTAKLGGDTYTAGAMAGAVNELVNGEIDKYNRTHPTNPIDAQRHQWLSAAVGAIVNASTNQALQTGAAEAVYGTKWNQHGFRPKYEGAWIFVPGQGFYRRIDGVDVYQNGTPPEGAHFWIQDSPDSNMGYDYRWGANQSQYIPEEVLWSGYIDIDGHAYGVTLVQYTKEQKREIILEDGKTLAKAVIVMGGGDASIIDDPSKENAEKLALSMIREAVVTKIEQLGSLKNMFKWIRGNKK